MGYSLVVNDYNTDYHFQIVSRKPCSIKDGLVVLNTPCYHSNEEELEVLLYNSSFDRVILLKKGYRIAQAVLVPKYQFNLQQ